MNEFISIVNDNLNNSSDDIDAVNYHCITEGLAIMRFIANSIKKEKGYKETFSK